MISSAGNDVEIMRNFMKTKDYTHRHTQTCTHTHTHTHIYIYIYIYPNPLHKHDATQSKVFAEVNLYNSVFCFSKTSSYAKDREPSLSYFLLKARGRKKKDL